MCDAIACIISGFMGGGINALRIRKSIILYHSESTPAFSCSVVSVCKCPISLCHASRQFTLPFSSRSNCSSGEIGMPGGMAGGYRMPAMIGKLGSNATGL